MENRERIRQLAANVKKDPADVFSKFALSLELLKNNQVEKALVLFESIYKNHPEYLGIYYHLGKLYHSMEDDQRAAMLFTEGIQLAEKEGEERTRQELMDALEELKAEE